MQKEISKCLLCGGELQSSVTWLYFTERFPKVICNRCEQKFEYINAISDDHIALYRYNDAMRDYLHRYKFMKDIILAKVFRKELNACLHKLKGIVVPVPLHTSKLQERTFAQVEELLNAAYIPYEQLLEKTSAESQSSKNREERIATPQLFNVKGYVQAQHYIIFDDIYTTGTTINHAKKALLEAGANSVGSVSLIRG